MTDIALDLRTRTYTWADPLESAARATALDGLTFLRAIAAGEIPPPPIASMLGMSIVEVEAGRVTFAMEPAEYMYNPIGGVHGGVFATILDSCMGCAVHSTLDAGVGYATTDLQVRLLGAMRADTGPVHATGTVIHAGGRTAAAEGRLVAVDSGRLLAHATTACLILR